MSSRITVLLAAEESAGLQVLRYLVEGGHEVLGVLTDGKGGPGATPASFAAARGIPVRPGAAVRGPELAGWITARGVRLLLNVHSLHIAAPAVLAAPAAGAFNLHPGPLPAYAGLNVPTWAIFRGEREHGVTLHRMEAKVDGGPVAYEKRFPLDGTETGFSLNARCIREGVPLVRRLVETVAAGCAIPSRAQEGDRRYFGRRPPQGGRIDWRRPAVSVDRLVRSLDFFPFPARLGEPRVLCEGRRLTISRLTRTGRPVGEAPPGQIRREGDRLLVACADEWIEPVRVRRDGAPCTPSEGLAGLDRLPA